MRGQNALQPFTRAALLQKCTGNVPQPSWSTLIKQQLLHLLQEPFHVATLFGEKRAETKQMKHKRQRNDARHLVNMQKVPEPRA